MDKDKTYIKNFEKTLRYFLSAHEQTKSCKSYMLDAQDYNAFLKNFLCMFCPATLI